MIYSTKLAINSQKKEILAFAFKQFGATFVNVMNGRTPGNDASKLQDLRALDAFKRYNHGYAHLRFAKVADFYGGSIHNLPKKNYEYNYIYYTKSTTFDKRSKIEHKIEKNLSDCCFNIRKEVLDNNADLDNFYILVDTGILFCAISKKEARENIIDTHEYNCRECYKVRLPNRFFKKEDLVKDFVQKFREIPESMISFDAKYIENVIYSSKYKASNKGFIKVENYQNGELQAIHYFISGSAVEDFFQSKGIKHKKCYYNALARSNGSIVSKDGSKEFRFSRILEIKETAVNNSNSSEESELEDLFHEQENLFPLQYPTNINCLNTVMDSNSPNYEYESQAQERSSNDDDDDDFLIFPREPSKIQPKKQQNTFVPGLLD